MKKNCVTGSRERAFTPLQKVLLSMKLSVFLFLLGIMSVQANELFSQTSLSMQMNSASLEQVLEEIKQQCDYDFIYDYEYVKELEDVTVEFNKASLDEVLYEVLKNTNLDYRVEDKMIVLFPREVVKPKVEEKVDPSVQQEKKELKGKVTDDQGIPLPGVSVVIKGTNIGVATNIDGEYVLEIESSKAVLIFSFVGMLPQEVAYHGQSVQDVTLSDDAKQMAEVVVTGYQTISKERATGSFTIISPKKLEKKLQSSLKSALEGQIAGLVVDKDGAIEIRGASSFRADNSPLIVVDGFPIEEGLETINPDNIANITVLKDAVSASIYGARSGNGVIVVTTKKGKKGESRISYKGSYGIQLKPDLSYLNKASSADYIDAELDLIEEDPNGPTNTFNGLWNLSPVEYLWHQKEVGDITEEEFNQEIERLKNVDGLSQIEDRLLRNKVMQQHSVTISNGTEKNLFNFSLNYNQNRNSTLNDKDDRLIVDLKDEWKFNDKVTLNLLSKIYFSNSQRPNTSIKQIAEFGYGFIKPYTEIYDPLTGESNNIFATNPKLARKFEDLGLKNMDYNALNEFNEGLTKSSNLGVRLGGSLNVKILDGLSMDLGYSYSRKFYNSKQRYSANSYKIRKLYNEATDLADPGIHYIPDGDMIKESRNISYDYTMRAQLNYKKEFNENHRVSAILGSEKRRNVVNNNNLGARYGYNELAGTFTVLNEKDLTQRANQTQRYVRLNESEFGSYHFVDNRYVSFYGNGSYEAFEKYILSGSVRIDQSNLFGQDPKYKYTPLWSVGLNYKLSKESFFDIDFIDLFQVRASYGINGNVARDNGPYLIIKPGRYSENVGDVSWTISSPPNNSLRWERTKSYNFGLDASMLNNNINVTIDGYVKNSDDLLAWDEIDPTYGFSSVLKNVGKIRNKGIELNVTTKIYNRDSFKWSSNLILGFNESEVVETSLRYKYAGSKTKGDAIVAGQPLKSLYSYRFAGLDDQGRSTVFDKDNNRILSSDAGVDDLVFDGTLRPKYNVSLTNNLYYKNFDLSFMFLYKGGHKMRKDAFSGSSYNHADVAKRWRKPGDEKNTIVPKLESWNMDIFYYPYMDVHTIDASYLKLRDVTLTYNIPKNIMEKVSLSTGRVYFQARNLFTWAANDCGIDPATTELDMGGTGAFTNRSSRRMPIMSEFYLGLSFSF